MELILRFTNNCAFELSTEFDEPFKFRSDLWNLPVMVKDPDLSEIAEDNPDGPSADDFSELLDFIRAYAVLIDPSSKMDAMIWPEIQNGVWYERRPASDVVNQAEKLGRWLGERVACLLERAEKSEL